MNPNINLDTLEVEGSGLEMHKMQVELTPVMYRILTNGLYQNKPRTVLQELVANAIDACKAVGSDRVVEVLLPTELSDVMSVKDYGVGMDRETLISSALVFGNSTKSETEEDIGGFGIGLKSIVSITNSATITTTKNGITTAGFIMIDEEASKYGILYERNEGREDGTIVEFVPLPTYVRALRDRSHSWLKGTVSYHPITINDTLIVTDGSDELSKWFHVPDTNITLEDVEVERYNVGRYANITANIGGFLFQLNHSMLNDQFKIKGAAEANIIIDIPVGKLVLPPSREYIEDNEYNRQVLNELLTIESKKLLNKINKGKDFKNLVTVATSGEIPKSLDLLNLTYMVEKDIMSVFPSNDVMLSSWINFGLATLNARVSSNFLKFCTEYDGESTTFVIKRPGRYGVEASLLSLLPYGDHSFKLVSSVVSSDAQIISLKNGKVVENDETGIPVIITSLYGTYTFKALANELLCLRRMLLSDSVKLARLSKYNNIATRLMDIVLPEDQVVSLIFTSRIDKATQLKVAGVQILKGRPLEDNIEKLKERVSLEDSRSAGTVATPNILDCVTYANIHTALTKETGTITVTDMMSELREKDSDVLYISNRLHNSEDYKETRRRLDLLEMTIRFTKIQKRFNTVKIVTSFTNKARHDLVTLTTERDRVLLVKPIKTSFMVLPKSEYRATPAPDYNELILESTVNKKGLRFINLVFRLARRDLIQTDSFLKEAVERINPLSDIDVNTLIRLSESSSGLDTNEEQRFKNYYSYRVEELNNLNSTYNLMNRDYLLLSDKDIIAIQKRLTLAVERNIRAILNFKDLL